MDFIMKIVKSDSPLYFTDPRVDKAKIEAVAAVNRAVAVLGKGNRIWRYVAGAPDRSGGTVGEPAKNGNLIDAGGNAVIIDGVVQPRPPPPGADGNNGDDGDDDDGNNDGYGGGTFTDDDDSMYEDDEEREGRRRPADDDTIDDRDRQRQRRVEAVAAEQDGLAFEMERLRLRLAGARARVNTLGTTYQGRGAPRRTDLRLPDGSLDY